MKGLLIKDVRLLMGQKSYYVVVIMIAIALLGSASSPSFVAGYLSMLCMMFVISSCSYDEFDNGYGCLFCLPVSRKGYVREKYVFGLLLGAFSAVIACAVLAGYAFFTGAVWEWKEIVFSVALLNLFFISLQAVMLPIQLKYGSEKGRIVQTVIWMSIFAVVFLGARLLDARQISMDGVQKMLAALPPAVLFFAVLLAVALIFLISLKISERIMEKKEF